MVNTNLTSFVVLVNWHAHYVVIIELICSTLCRPTLCTMLICFCVCFFHAFVFFAFLLLLPAFWWIKVNVFHSPRIKLAALNFARRFIGVVGRESPILGNFVPPEAQNRTNRSPAWPAGLGWLTSERRSIYSSVSSRAKRRAMRCGWCAVCACGRRIGMCEYRLRLSP